jgi:DNA-binding NtrC family response regulator
MSQDATPLGRVLVVDDERQQRDILQTTLESEGYAAATAANGPQALEALQQARFDLVLTDLKMPGMNGVVLLQELLRASPDICVILMTAHGAIDTAVDAMKKGAFDYLSKPLDREQLLLVLRRSMERVRLSRENQQLQEQLRERFRIGNIVGESGAMQDVFRVVHKIARSSASVLVYGEGGTGKELIARAIHVESDRAARPFHAFSLAALPESGTDAALWRRSSRRPARRCSSTTSPSCPRTRRRGCCGCCRSGSSSAPTAASRPLWTRAWSRRRRRTSSTRCARGVSARTCSTACR